MEDWPAFSTVKDVGLFLLAVWGAALSTFVWRQSAMKERRRVKVKLSGAMAVYGDDVSPAFMNIEATNVGNRPVTVKTLAIQLSSGERIHPGLGGGHPGMQSTLLPASLLDGESAQSYLSNRGIGEALIQHGLKGKIKLTPVCVDSVGGVYKGKHFKVDPVEFSQM